MRRPLIAALLVVTTTACGDKSMGPFAVASQNETIGGINTYSTAASIASTAAKNYSLASVSATNSVQFFEVPIIAAAITAVSALSFSGSPADLALGAGLTGAGFGAFSQYYAPRAKANILGAAGEAADCLGGLAGRIDNHKGDTVRDLIDGKTVDLPADVINWATSTNDEAIVFQRKVLNGPQDIRRALAAVDRSVGRNWNAASSQPDFQTVADNVKKSAVRTAEDTQRINSANLTVNARATPAPPPAIVTLVTSLESDITTCKAMAGI